MIKGCTPGNHVNPKNDDVKGDDTFDDIGVKKDEYIHIIYTFQVQANPSHTLAQFINIKSSYSLTQPYSFSHFCIVKQI